ncbi:MAG TPA: biopolymer transporter TolR [Chitinophagaceae bacterium]|jgi:Tol biopolymer transport system component
MTVKIAKLFTVLILFLLSLNSVAQTVGIFDGHDDVGKVLHKGALSYDVATDRYELTGSGSNIWLNHDEFQFAWKKMKGDFILQARGVLLGEGTEEHRKFGLMIRSSLDTSSPMVCTALHGNGLTSLQFRRSSGANVEQDTFLIRSPDVIELERRGNQFIMSVAHSGETYTANAISDLNLGDEVYVGLFICSHNKDVSETASFDNVRMIIPAKPNFVPYRDYLGSHIETMDVATGHREIIYSSPVSLQAPNWMPDDKALVYNSNGLMYKLDFKKLTPEVLNTDSIKRNNNDHVLSFDGSMLGLSSGSGKYNSLVFTVPSSGGVPKQITPVGPSYLHGWSPDKKYLVYTAERGDGNFDIYRVSSNGGTEQRVTTTPGLDDGPEYSPDGKYIYFNSVRSGTMQIWRMNSDGTNQVQITSDEFNNWFPHISPDGKWIQFLSFSKDVKPDDHPFYKHVYLRIMPVGYGQSTVIAYLYGGQGSINTPSWSPDSKKIAFVSNTQIN